MAWMASCSTSRSTLRVDTPLTYASITTATIACSQRRRGCKNDGKYAGPDLVLGICSSISPTLVSQARSRYPLRFVTRSAERSPRPAPVSVATSAAINSRTTNPTASRSRSPCSPATARATTSAGVIIRSSAIVVLLFIDSEKSRRAWTPRWSD
jgi:hypothetical protein